MTDLIKKVNEFNAGETWNIGILLFPEVEVLDFAGPFEVFTLASRIASEQDKTKAAPFKVFTIAEKAELIETTGGLRIQPEYAIMAHPHLDILIIPGGQGTRTEINNTYLLTWLGKTMLAARINASVCTGVFLMAQAGLLTDHIVTTHAASLDRLAATFPKLQVAREVRWVDENEVLSSAGISAGLDMSLHLVERLLGENIAQATATRMEYSWDKTQPTLKTNRGQVATS